MQQEVDETDIGICIDLHVNSRRTYRDLADRHSMSVNAIHKRIQSLIDAGIIGGFNSMIDPSLFDTVQVCVFGRSRLDFVYDAVDAIMDDDRVAEVMISGQNQMYITGVVEGEDGIPSFVDKMSSTTSMDDPLIGTAQPPSSGTGVDSLSRTDLRIVSVLMRDSRTPSSTIAEKVGSSTRTVNRRLRSMEESGIVRHTLQWMPSRSNDMIAFLHARLDDADDAGRVTRELIADLSPRVIGIGCLNEYPDRLFINIWTRTMHELRGTIRDLIDRGTFVGMETHILLDRYFNRTWIHDRVDSLAWPSGLPRELEDAE